MKIAESFPNGWKTMWEKEKLLLRAISSFPTLFLKDLYCRHVKNQGLFGQGLKNMFIIHFAYELSVLSVWPRLKFCYLVKRQPFYFLCPCIDRSGTFSFRPVFWCVCIFVCLYAKIKTSILAINFDTENTYIVLPYIKNI